MMRGIDWYQGNAHVDDRQVKGLSTLKCHGYRAKIFNGRTVILPCNRTDEEKRRRVYIFKDKKPNFFMGETLYQPNQALGKVGNEELLNQV